ncbi:hypothetical protein JW899_00945 [Candidatus Uhrbacteria bacterium]|nr:hypothetical protein [Candidatus Uhrbacteria bacterium]
MERKTDRKEFRRRLDEGGMSSDDADLLMEMLEPLVAFAESGSRPKKKLPEEVGQMINAVRFVTGQWEWEKAESARFLTVSNGNCQYDPNLRGFLGPEDENTCWWNEERYWEQHRSSWTGWVREERETGFGDILRSRFFPETPVPSPSVREAIISLFGFSKRECPDGYPLPFYDGDFSEEIRESVTDIVSVAVQLAVSNRREFRDFRLLFRILVSFVPLFSLRGENPRKFLCVCLE